MNDTTTISDFDFSAWPIVRFRMPDHVPDELAQGKIAQFDALLARDERFVLVFHGAEMPKDSKAFMKLYRDWFKRTRATQQRLCAGAVRVEPDERRRGSFAIKALSLANKIFLPYPYKVVADDSEAVTQAHDWLKATESSRG